MDLTWAPDVPGWPRAGGDWYDAQDACQHLNEVREAYEAYAPRYKGDAEFDVRTIFEQMVAQGQT